MQRKGKLAKRGVFVALGVAVLLALSWANYLVWAGSDLHELKLQRFVENARYLGVDEVTSEGLYWATLTTGWDEDAMSRYFRKAGFKPQYLDFDGKNVKVTGESLCQNNIKGVLTWHRPFSHKAGGSSSSPDKPDASLPETAEYLSFQVFYEDITEDITSVHKYISRAGAVLEHLTHNQIKTWTIKGEIEGILDKEQMSQLAAHLLEIQDGGSGKLGAQTSHHNSLNVLAYLPSLPAEVEIEGEPVNLNMAFKSEPSQEITRFYAGFPFLSVTY